MCNNCDDEDTVPAQAEKYSLPIVLFKSEGAPPFTAAINSLVQNLLTDCGTDMYCAISTDKAFYEHINRAAKEWVDSQEGPGPFEVASVSFDTAIPVGE